MTTGFELLKFNHAGAMLLKNGVTANYGVISNENGLLTYFTGKGLREIWAPDMTSEQKTNADRLRKVYEEGSAGIEKLKQSGHIAITRLSEIERVLF